jgi:hypothetical protein
MGRNTVWTAVSSVTGSQTLRQLFEALPSRIEPDTPAQNDEQRGRVTPPSQLQIAQGDSAPLASLSAVSRTSVTRRRSAITVEAGEARTVEGDDICLGGDAVVVGRRDERPRLADLDHHDRADAVGEARSGLA